MRSDFYDETIQAFFQRMDPEFDERSPATVLRAANLDEMGPELLHAATESS